MWSRHYIHSFFFYMIIFSFVLCKQTGRTAGTFMPLVVDIVHNHGIVFISFTPVLECMGVCVRMHLVAAE